MKLTLFLSFLFCLLSPIQGRDTITNAFDDLSRDGKITEEESPMRVRATQEMQDALQKACPESGFLCFPERRENGMRSPNFVPEPWAKKTKEERESFSFSAQPGEFTVYQLGLYAVKTPLNNVQITFSPLVNEAGDRIQPDKMTCFNLEGTDIKGKTFTQKVNVPQGKLQSLWMGIELSQKNKGIYSGTVTITPENGKPETIKINLNVSGEPVLNNGDNEGKRQSRLRWLNSTVGSGTKPTAPYTPIKVKNKSIRYLGGEFTLSESGLPSSITTFYNESNTLTPAAKNSVLEKGLSLTIETDQGKETLTPSEFKLKKDSAGSASWTAKSMGKNVSVTCNGVFEFDGTADISFMVEAKNDVQIKDIQLTAPFSASSSRYFMGLGKSGGALPELPLEWKWDSKKHQDGFWMGNVNSGLKIKFRDQNYKRPLVNVYYKYGQLTPPAAWANNGKGGINISLSENNTPNVTAYSGERLLKKGEKLDFGMELLITPVKPLDWEHQTKERYYHSNSDLSTEYLSEAKKKGANIINIHHKKEIYPFINYPYYDESAPDLKKFIDEAHAENIQVKAYYTTREISIKLPELWAFRSLGGELIMDGPGKDSRTVTNPSGPNKWLTDNLEDHFIPAWHNAFHKGKYAGEKDVSVITTPDSRLNNYYLAGLDWMVGHMGLDGIYIDDSALDREAMKRARRILDADGKRRAVDLHSWNHMNGHAGHISSMLLYADLSPYIDRLWIGEGFTPNSTPDFWMVEISGIPFGLMSETLNSHNYWRGMIHGMTPRLPWSGDPTPLWKLYDSFGMKEAKMLGYWNKNVPVTTDSDQAKSTVYLKKNKAVVVVANWTGEPLSTTLQIDEKKLGFRPTKAYMPAMEKIQPTTADVDLSKPLSLAPKQGAFIILEK